MTTKLPEAIEEVTASIEAMTLPHEGLRDFSRLDLSQKSARDLGDRINRWNKRKQLADDFIAAATALLEDGYPELESPPLRDGVLEDLLEQKRTIDAAMALFVDETQAKSLSLKSSDPVLK